MANMKAFILSSLLLATITSLAFAYDEAGGGGGGGRDRELQSELEQCQQRCQTQHRGQRQQQQCQSTCQSQYEAQRREEDERQRRERRGERDEEEFNPQDPQQQLQRCRQTCSQRFQGGQEKQLCDRRCQQVYERQQRERGGERDDEVELNPQDPQQELQRCQRTCSQRHQGGEEEQRCERRCQETYEKQQRERRGQRDDEEELNPQDPRQELQRCQQTCSQRHQGGQEQQRCERRCQETYEQQQKERRGQRDDEDELNPQDPRQQLQRCQQTCSQRFHGAEEQQRCERRCQETYEQQHRERGHGDRDSDEMNDHHREDPQRRLQRCQQDCRSQSRDQRQVQECQQRCQRRYEEERQRQQGRGREERDNDVTEREQRESRSNPYHFQSQRLQSRFQTDEGHLKILEKFSQRSELLRGLENYRLAVLEAQPSTFVSPHHCDADSVLVVTRGKGTINVLSQNNKESHNIERTDVVIVPAGSTVYMTNQDNKERLQIVKLVTSINIPGQFEELFPGGSAENPQSYFSAFSNNLLKQSLSATEEQIERLTGEQRQGQRQGRREGFIKRASQEQLRSLSQHATSPKRRGRESSGPVISLQNQSPLYSNSHGKFYEVNPQQNKQLKDMDVLVNWCELNQGTIMVPHYNSKTTILAMVVEGSGRMEMACPHLSRQSQRRGEQEEESQSGQIERVTAQLSPGDVFIVPAGHPIALVATSNEKLRVVGFGVNARNNERNFIAGKDNIIKQLEKEAQQLAFNMQGSEVEQIFNQPKLSYFVPQQQQEGRDQSHPLSSILNLAGFA